MNSKPSNVIKILNPIYPTSSDGGSRIVLDTHNIDLQKTQNRD